ncbi:MAG: hypothetical protein WCS52_01325 [bacterium]
MTTTTGTPPSPHRSAHSELLSPVEIVAVTARGDRKLSHTDMLNWSAGSIRVSLVDTSDSLAIDIEAPGESLASLIIRWRHPSHFLLLGDHWERSYGDLHWEPENPDRIMPWYFMANSGAVTHGAGVKTGGNSFAAWNLCDGVLKLVLDTRCGGSGVQLGARTLRAAEIVVLKGDGSESPFQATQRFCSMMCPKPRLPKAPVYGINDWYFAYGAITREVILDHAEMLAPLAVGNANKPFCVIDAGWAKRAPGKETISCWADYYDTPHDSFGDMTQVAGDLRKLGYRPALWTRPLCASHTDNPNLLVPHIPRVEALGYPILDPTIPENLERIKHNLHTYRQWGYEMVKHDFSTVDLFGKWGFQMITDRDMTFPGWHFHDQSLTNAEVVLQLYQALRDAAGDELLLLGCNTISHLSAGLFEVQRIGDDTSGQEWARTRKMGVNTLGFRAPQHNRFYAADGDCVGLTPAVPWAKNKQWMQLLAESGTPLFISAQKEAVGQEQRAFMKECFTLAARDLPVGEPLDWQETPFPRKWKLNGKTVDFNWDE